jgi:ABC-type multidrug transport system ATPase subunit
MHRWLVLAARLPRALASVAATTREPDAAPARTVLAPSPPVLTISGLERRFGAHEVVRDLDLTLGFGERVALWGPNGSGKTTVIRCIAGSLAPTTGEISIGGHTAGSLPARRLLGLSLAQERSFYMRLSGRNNLLFFARLRYDGDRDAARAVDALGDELELDEILATRADACSAGMLQQLAFARALLGDPALILLDEPTRSLDVDAVERLWDALERRKRAAVVVASHNLEDAERCGRRIDFPT